MSVVIALSALVGLVLLITRSSVSNELRVLISTALGRHSKFSLAYNKLTTCGMCSGFWVGMLYGYSGGVLECLTYGLILSLVSAFVVLLHDTLSAIIDWLEIRIMRDQG